MKKSTISIPLTGSWPKWGPDPHNPWSGKDRPAFNWDVYKRYTADLVDQNGNPYDTSKTDDRSTDTK